MQPDPPMIELPPNTCGKCKGSGTEPGIAGSGPDTYAARTEFLAALRSYGEACARAALEAAAQMMDRTAEQCRGEDADAEPFIWAAETLRAMKVTP
jgi:hypothetical protein